jgi:hypothetical protein
LLFAPLADFDFVIAGQARRRRQKSLIDQRILNDFPQNIFKIYMLRDTTLIDKNRHL